MQDIYIYMYVYIYIYIIIIIINNSTVPFDKFLALVTGKLDG